MRVLQGDEENELGDVEGHREAGHAAVAAGSPEVRARNDTCYTSCCSYSDCYYTYMYLNCSCLHENDAQQHDEGAEAVEAAVH